MRINKNIVINVGLENSPSDHYEVTRILDKYIHSGSYWISSRRVSNYGSFTITQGETKLNQLQLHEALSYICKLLNRNEIQYQYKGSGFVALPDSSQEKPYNKDKFLSI